MNLVGKILTGLIALFSVLFMALALAVYAGHQNWKTQATNLQTQLTKERQDKQKLETDKDTLQKDLDAEKKTAATRIKALEDEQKRLQDERGDLKKQVADLDTKSREAIGAMQTTQQAMNAAAEQVKKLRQDVRDVETKRNQEFQTMVDSTEKLHQLANDFRELKKTNNTLVVDLQKYRQIFDKLGLKADPGAYERTAPPVAGHVMAVSDNGTGLIEINVGNDQGLSKGQELEIFRMGDRGATYLGKVEVVSTEPHRAVAKIIPNFQKGSIQKGDNVTSRLQ